MSRRRRSFATEPHADSPFTRVTLVCNGLTPQEGERAGPAAVWCHSDVITRYGGSWLRIVHQFDDSLKVLDRPELDYYLALAFAQTHRHTGVEGG